MNEFWAAAIASIIIATCGHDSDVRGIGWACCIVFAMICIVVTVAGTLFG